MYFTTPDVEAGRDPYLLSTNVVIYPLYDFSYQQH